MRLPRERSEVVSILSRLSVVTRTRLKMKTDLAIMIRRRSVVHRANAIGKTLMPVRILLEAKMRTRASANASIEVGEMVPVIDGVTMTIGKRSHAKIASATKSHPVGIVIVTTKKQELKTVVTMKSEEREAIADAIVTVKMTELVRETAAVQESEVEGIKMGQSRKVT